MKALVEDYKFDKDLRQITFTGNLIPSVLEEILIITNVTTGDILYSFADKLRGGSLSNNILTLIYDTSKMSNSDRLQIFVDSDQYQDFIMTMMNTMLRAMSYAKDSGDRMRTIVDGGSLSIYTRASGTPLNGSTEPWYSALSWNDVDAREQLMEISKTTVIQGMQRWVKS